MRTNTHRGKVGLIPRLLHTFLHSISHLFTSPMATLHVASTGADRCLEKQGWKTPRLPEIVHPLQRVEDR